jgi:hypothetical protein
MYALYDSTPGGGYFVVNGVTQPSGQNIFLTPAQLAQTTFVVGATSDEIIVNAFDGKVWQAKGPVFHVNPVAPVVNHAPVVTAPDKSAAVGSSLAAASLFSASDPDGDALSMYALYDATPGSGYFVVNGVAQPAGQNIFLTPAQLAQTTFVVGATPDEIIVNAFDGKVWQAKGPVFHITPPVNHAPVVTAPDKGAAAGSSLAASSLFSASDPDGDTLVKYAFYDATPGGGYFVVNGVVQPAGQNIYLTPAQLAQTVFVVGTGSDHIIVNAFDGVTWQTRGAEFKINAGGAAAFPGPDGLVFDMTEDQMPEPFPVGSSANADNAGQSVAAAAICSGGCAGLIVAADVDQLAPLGASSPNHAGEVVFDFGQGAGTAVIAAGSYSAIDSWSRQWEFEPAPLTNEHPVPVAEAMHNSWLPHVELSDQKLWLALHA